MAQKVNETFGRISALASKIGSNKKENKTENEFQTLNARKTFFCQVEQIRGFFSQVLGTSKAR